MTSNNTLAAGSGVVGDDIRRVERSIQTAMRDTAQLFASIIDTAHAGSVAAGICHAAVSPVAETLEGLLRTHATVSRKAHRTLEAVGRSLRLTETDWGGGEPKHAEKAVTEALAEPHGSAVPATAD